VSVTNETLMAYADGELDAAGCAEVEEAMRADASIERRIAQFREERRLLQAAYAGELDEPLPENILAPLRQAPPANVVDFKRRGVGSPRRMMRWRYTALAAGIVMAVGVGVIAWQRSLMIRNVGNAELAGGALARALSDQLSADTNTGEVHVGLSFLAKSGAYCRTFTIAGGSSNAGLACRREGQWQIDILVPSKGEDGSTYRPAGTEIPPEVLRTVEAEIAGEPLDGAGEMAARAGHWQAPRPR
jgi:hypothetical protein